MYLKKEYKVMIVKALSHYLQNLDKQDSYYNDFVDLINKLR